HSDQSTDWLLRIIRHVTTYVILITPHHSIVYIYLFFFFFFFFNDPATTEIYTLSLHDALPITPPAALNPALGRLQYRCFCGRGRSEEHTSELQSRGHLVCRLLLEKKKKKKKTNKIKNQ